MEFQLFLVLTLVISGALGVSISNQKDIDVEANNTISDPILKIVGGSNAFPHIAPWIVSLQVHVARPNRLYHTCGGAIISPEWILTAGHCVISASKQMEVIAGRHNFQHDESLTQQQRSVKKLFIHPNYKGGVAPNDIGLIRLATPLELTTFVQNINLPNDNELMPQGLATLYGWGSTSNTIYPAMPNILQTMTAPIITNEQCRRILRAGNLISDSTVCTGPINGRLSACSGDSGSALTQDKTIIGVVSWGLDPCGLPNSASVYTKVSAYKQWILDTIANNK